jgi:hypothetical protein
VHPNVEMIQNPLEKYQIYDSIWENIDPTQKSDISNLKKLLRNFKCDFCLWILEGKDEDTEELNF